MMTSDSLPILTIDGRHYTRRQLLTWDAAEEPPGLGENALAALAFACQWLAGEERFDLRTSGSTGEPKPILLTRAQMEASARATAAALDLRSGQNALVCLPTRYVAGRMMLVRGFVLGLRLLVVEPSSDPLANLPPGWQPDFASFVPLQMQSLLAIALQVPGDSCFAGETERAVRYRRLLDGMHAILLGGGPVGEPLHDQVRKLSAPVYHTYAMTETATHVALRRLNGPGETDAFVPLPGVELAADSRGCLTVRGPMTAGAWIQTNDLVDLRADRSFVWLGRSDNVINSGGVKVHSEKVEAALEKLQLLHADLAWAGRRLAVAGQPDERLGQIVTLVLEGSPLTLDQEAELAALLTRSLGRFATPRRFAYLPRLPLTPTGKIDRVGVLEVLARR
jgi:O-succinylbenzoic acid--CoA ligase